MEWLGGNFQTLAQVLSRNWFTACIKCFIQLNIFKFDLKERERVRAMNNWKSLIRVKGAFQLTIYVHWRSVALALETFSDRVAFFTCEFSAEIFISRLWEFLKSMDFLHCTIFFHRPTPKSLTIGQSWGKIFPSSENVNRMLRTILGLSDYVVARNGQEMGILM